MKLMRKTVALLLALTLLCAGMTAAAAQPKGYWPYLSAYNTAKASGNADAILAKGDALLQFYSKFTVNRDIAEMSYNIYNYRYEAQLFEKKGNLTAAVANLKKLQYFADYLGYSDMSILCGARIRKLDPKTGVYAACASGAPSFGAKYEPACGTYYGRVADMNGTTARNAAALASEKMVSVYVELGVESIESFSWLLSRIDDGKHIIHIAWNFPNEKGTVTSVNAGAYDSRIKSDLAYLATLKSPVFLRIGAEMNVWTNTAAGADFRAAYTRIAKEARTIAPNAALVFSPNFTGAWGSHMRDYYPGDAYVDWVGVSLYANSADKSARDSDNMYFGNGKYADFLLSVREVAETFTNKPLMLSECGTVTTDPNVVQNLTQLYSTLTMVYPQIKAVIYFDTAVGENDYRLAGTAAGSAYAAAVAANPTLIGANASAAMTYVPLEKYTCTAGSVLLGAYSQVLGSREMTVTFQVDGKTAATCTAYPYTVTLDTAAMTAGNHAVAVRFTSGAYTETKSYTLVRGLDGSVRFTTGAAAAMDVPAAWAQAEIAEAVAAKLVPAALQSGYTDKITRADFCRLIVNLLCVKSGKDTAGLLAANGVAAETGAFSDTKDADILAAYALGIVSGVGGGRFSPQSHITREQAAKMLCLAAQKMGASSVSGAAADFADKSTFSAWAGEYISFVSAQKDLTSGSVVMGGVGGGQFAPKDNYTRQQAYVTMLRLFRSI